MKATTHTALLGFGWMVIGVAAMFKGDDVVPVVCFGVATILLCVADVGRAA